MDTLLLLFGVTDVGVTINIIFLLFFGRGGMQRQRSLVGGSGGGGVGGWGRVGMKPSAKDGLGPLSAGRRLFPRATCTTCTTCTVLRNEINGTIQ